MSDDGGAVVTAGGSAAQVRRPRGALAVISMTQLLIVLDGSIVTIALPYIGADLDLSSAGLRWLIVGYVLPFGALLLLGGRLGDQFGHRRMLVIGMVGFAAASALGGFAPNAAVVIVARVLQGVCAALIAPAALALVTTAFAAGAPRNRAFGVYAAMSGAGNGLGLLIGGALTGLDGVGGVAIDGWRLTLLINVPIAVAVAVLAPRMLRESPRRRARIDVPGSVLGSAGLVALVYGFTRAGEGYGWGDPGSITALALGGALLIAFVLVERRSSRPLLPLRILNDPVRAGSYAALTLAMAAMFAMFYFLSLFVQQIMGYQPLVAGVAFLPLSIGIFVAATVAGRLMTRVRPGTIAGIGALLAVLAMVLFARVTVDDGPTAAIEAVRTGSTVGAAADYWLLLFPGLMAMAVGMGLVMAGLTPTALHRVDPADTGVGSGLFNTTQQLGGAIGLAVLSTVALHGSEQRAARDEGPIVAALGEDRGAVRQALLQSTFTDGMTLAFGVGSVLLVAASAIVWVVVRRDGAADDDVGHRVTGEG